MNPHTLHAEVVDILDETTVVLNVGTEQGVQRGIRFVIYAEAGQLTDSKGRNLGVLEIPKGEVEVVDVQPKLSVAKSSSITSIGNIMSEIVTATSGTKVRVPLDVDKSTITPRRIDVKVRKGDGAWNVN